MAPYFKMYDQRPGLDKGFRRRASSSAHPLRIRLQTYQVDHLPFYHAISYCWGDGPADRECRCDDDTSAGSLWLSDNLWQALKQIRRIDADVPLWADQLCIDQHNEEEKTHQVQLMRRVFGRASQVIVWLGVADAQTALAFDLIDNVAKQVVDQVKKLGNNWKRNIRTEYYPLEISPADSPEWSAFRGLFSRPWFSRLWVFQEVVLSQEARIVCGQFSTSIQKWTMICEVAEALDRRTTDHLANLKEVDGLAGYISVCNSMNSSWFKATLIRQAAPYCFELLNLMRVLAGQKVSLPQDHVYALLGVAEDVEPLTFPVNYSQPFRDLFVYITKFFVKRYSDLSVLTLVSIGPSSKVARSGPRELPSWVPDYRFEAHRYNERLTSGPKSVKHGLDRHYNSTGSSRASAVLERTLTLGVNGVYVGTIQVLSEPDNNLEDGKGIGDNVLNDGQWSQIVNSYAPDKIYGPTGEHISIAYARLRLTDYLPGENEAVHRSARLAPPTRIPEPNPSSLISIPNGEPLLRSDAGDFMTACIIQSTTRQRLFITDSGYMGLCHQSCVLGDQVWLLMGGDMPFILRELDNEPVTHQFKGESYVHGIMDGEYLLNKFKSGGELSDKEWLNSLADALPFETENLVLS
ncbi:hypothetical protein EPUS_03045 [Endocarpon pusillum Z07020]|uniref:Heterokaryon incompatibility domain-containing protein n=1 Tax=Endocarpon pusillum (strain Z07020 / HMAS-L-300199) TaxID=1263415 RepID=U1HV47_ENDPU|nr:uncharacterized protein EPUS_03045 [Endocarpon pusillum Z07020]ERF73204.1 hypothetical protein EPUS_03045 [Endocarpon pusillum Z07020]